jgi:hypothetical protein
MITFKNIKFRRQKNEHYIWRDQGTVPFHETNKDLFGQPYEGAFQAVKNGKLYIPYSAGLRVLI